MDLGNVVATFAVVVLHCTTYVFSNSGDAEWMVDVPLQCIFLFAVPFFFMISGANLLGYRERYSTGTFFRKRLKRVVFPLVVGSVIFYGLGMVAPETFGLAPKPVSLSTFLGDFMHNRINSVYWFFYSIIILYLVTPVFSKIADDEKTLSYAIILSLITMVVFPMVERFAPDHTLFESFAIPYLSGSILYYLMGYYLVHYERHRIPTLLVAVVGVIFLAGSIYMTYRTNLGHGMAPLGQPGPHPGKPDRYDSFYAQAYGPFTIIYATALFILFTRLEPLLEDWKGNAAMKRLSTMSLGIYVIHMLVITTFDARLPHVKNLVWLVGLRPFAVFALSALLAWAGLLIMRGHHALLARIRD